MKYFFVWVVIGFFFLWILLGLNDTEIVRKGTVSILMFICVAMARIEILFVINKILHDKETESTRFTSRKLDINIGGNPLLGVAGEDLEFGDTVIFGDDGKIYKSVSGQ